LASVRDIYPVLRSVIMFIDSMVTLITRNFQGNPDANDRVITLPWFDRLDRMLAWKFCRLYHTFNHCFDFYFGLLILIVNPYL
jgi:hypothetical protein